MIEFAIAAVIGIVILLIGGLGGFTLAQHMLPDWASRAVNENRELRRQLAALPRRTDIDYEDMECGCGHHRAYHDPKSGKCSGIDRKRHPTYTTQFKDYPCSCRQYVGPTEVAKPQDVIVHPRSDMDEYEHDWP